MKWLLYGIVFTLNACQVNTLAPPTPTASVLQSPSPLTTPDPHSDISSGISVVEAISIKGQVTDAQGKLVTGARVIIHSTDPSVPLHAEMLTEQGFYELKRAPYDIELEISATLPGQDPLLKTETFRRNSENKSRSYIINFEGQAILDPAASPFPAPTPLPTPHPTATPIEKPIIYPSPCPPADLEAHPETCPTPPPGTGLVPVDNSTLPSPTPNVQPSARPSAQG